MKATTASMTCNLGLARSDSLRSPTASAGKADHQPYKVMPFIVILMLVGCGGHSVPPHSNNVLDQLYAQHQEWQGTPYKLGGYDKGGIDCSGFVARTYADLFDQQLPRTTTAQSKTGYLVKRDELKAGDLVFFKIANRGKLQHVGIYLENNQFVHASTSKGVTISNLANNYWQKSYWKAIRL